MFKENNMNIPPPIPEDIQKNKGDQTQEISDSQLLNLTKNDDMKATGVMKPKRQEKLIKKSIDANGNHNDIEITADDIIKNNTAESLKRAATTGCHLKIIYGGKELDGIIETVDNDKGKVSVKIWQDGNIINVNFDQETVWKWQKEKIEKMIKEKYGTIMIHEGEPYNAEVIGLDKKNEIVHVKYQFDNKIKSHEADVDMVKFLSWQNDKNFEKIISRHMYKFPNKRTGNEIKLANTQHEINKLEIEASPPVTEKANIAIQEKITAWSKLEYKDKENPQKIIDGVAVKINNFGIPGYITNIREDGRAVLLNIPFMRNYTTPEGEQKEEPYFDIKWVNANDIVKLNWPELAVQERKYKETKVLKKVEDKAA